MLERIRTVSVLLLGLALLVGSTVKADEPTLPAYEFGKYSDGYYIGGTSGLSGADSIRGAIDSLFFRKWVENSDRRIMDPIATVIYGDDDRRDIYTLSDPDYLRLAQAACLIVSLGEIHDNGDGTYNLLSSPWTMQSGIPLCPDERFLGQLRMGNCSGFLVAEDLIVTAGHCVTTCGNWAFVFGYEQTDSLTAPAQTISEDNVYYCVEILDRVYSGEYDHCLLRLDRPVVGRAPLAIRRSGSVTFQDSLVIVGHPKGLPMKLSAGAIVQNDQPAMPWFQANLDSYAGNSGSMVVNTETWRVEGILVRGAPDFVYDGGCAASHVLPNTGDPDPGSTTPFEEITKIGILAGLIPELVASAGDLELDRALYNCDDQIEITLRDLDLASVGTFDLLVITAADSELVAVTETAPGEGVFHGYLSTSSGTVVKHDGLLQGSHGDILTVVYEDADNGSGSPVDVEIQGEFDCQAPIISQVAIVDYGATWVTVSFETDEFASGQVWVGETCGDPISSAAGAGGTSHSITVNLLDPLTSYNAWVAATDVSGNEAVDDNGGGCYAFATGEQPDFLTEQFYSGCDLQQTLIVFIPDGSPGGYQACTYPSDGLPGPTGGPTAELDDDDYLYIPLTGGKMIEFFGVSYSGVYIGSNGYVTFGAGDDDWSATLQEHFDGPPRFAAFWADLDPTASGRVSYQQLVDRFLITWHSIPGVSTSNSVTVQVHFFFDGKIVAAWGDMMLSSGLVGLSDGSGLSNDFLPSNLNEYPGCDLITCYIDADNDHFGNPTDYGHYEVGPDCAEYASLIKTDCNDNDATIYPGAPEVADDQIDQDCDQADATCCEGVVGDVNGDGSAEPSIGDITKLIDHLFGYRLPLICFQEADANQSGGRYPVEADITIGDISTLIDHLFITEKPLLPCLSE
jgi:hypothetical protein